MSVNGLDMQSCFCEFTGFCCGTLLKEFTLLIESTLICLNEGPESKTTEGT